MESLSTEDTSKNVFALITKDIPKSKFEQVISLYRTREPEFTSYLDSLNDSFLDPSQIKDKLPE